MVVVALLVLEELLLEFEGFSNDSMTRFPVFLRMALQVDVAAVLLAFAMWVEVDQMTTDCVCVVFERTTSRLPSREIWSCVALR